MELAVNDMKIEKYSEYKDSGEKWIGKIPKHWSVKKLGNLLSPVSIKNQPDLPLLSITREKGVILRDLDNEEENHNFIPDDLSNYKVIRRGQFGMNKMKAWQGSYGISEYDGIVSPAYFIFDLDIDVVKKFFHSAIRSRLYVSFFGSASDGVRVGQWDLSKPRMREIPFLVPPKEEQNAIAQFLDRKTAQIDKAIAQKEKLIELLKERRQILIHIAVTRGLNPNVKLKPSGVEWIGEIPENWEVKKIIGLCRIVRGNSSFSKDELLNKGEYVALQYGKTYKVDEIDEQYEFYVNDEFYKESQIVNFGDVIIISTSETIEDLGHSVFYNRNDLGLLGGEQILLKPKVGIVDANYLHFSTKVFSKELRKYSTGIKVFRFNINDLKTIYTPVPPIPEQNAIVTYIKTQTSIIKKVITFQEQQIEKLKEYKATLINSAVTGKLRVPSIQEIEVS